MGFDLASAKPVSQFDPESGRPVVQPDEGGNESRSAISKMISNARQNLGMAYNMSPMGGMHNLIDTSNKLLEEGAFRAGGAATDATGSPAVGTGVNLGVQAIPMVMGGGLARAAGPLLEKAGLKTLQSALKPPTDMVVSGEAERGMRKMLDEGINATRGGAVDLRRAIDKSRAAADAEIKAASARGAEVGREKVYSEFENLAKKAEERTFGDPDAALDRLKSAWEKYRANVPEKIDIEQAQRIKRGAQKHVSDSAYGELATLEKETEKGIARGLRREIEAQQPSVAPINQNTKDLVTALKMVEPRSAVAGNNTTFGMAPAAMNPKAAAIMMADKNAYLRSLLARGLYNTGRSQNLGKAGALAGTAYGQITGNE